MTESPESSKDQHGDASADSSDGGATAGPQSATEKRGGLNADDRNGADAGSRRRLIRHKRDSVPITV